MDSSSGYERHFDDIKYSARVWTNYYREKPERIFHVLLGLLYVLILALFITVFSRAGKAQLVSKKEITDFQSKVSSLFSAMEQLESTFKEKNCDPGWKKFESRCYFQGNSKTDWKSARKICLGMDSDLVVINTQKELMFLTGKTNPSQYNRFWIGLHDIDAEGDWKWVDGTDYKTSYKAWSQGEPNDEDDEDCVHMWSNGEWNDVPCTYDRCYALCERAL